MRVKEFKREDTGETRKIQIRALKKKEIRSLKEYGYGSFFFKPDGEHPDDAIDKALEAVLSAEELEFLDECGNTESTRAWKEMLKETYGAKEEEKNSPATTGGTGTKTASNTAESAPPTENENLNA